MCDFVCMGQRELKRAGECRVDRFLNIIIKSGKFKRWLSSLTTTTTKLSDEESIVSSWPA